MENEEKRPPWMVTLLSRLWESFLERFLVPIILAVLMGGFTLARQWMDHRTTKENYNQVADLLNRDLPKQLEALRQQSNAQGDAIKDLKLAVLALQVDLAVEQEIRKIGDRRARRAPASQPKVDSEAPFKQLKAKAAPKPMPPILMRSVPARMD